MLMEQARRDIVDYGKKLISDGMTNGTTGNISIFDRKEGLMAISPSGMPYQETKPSDIVIMDLDGNIVEGDRKPSSEHALHTIFYRKRQDVNAIVHCHSIYCTTLACLGEPLRAVHYQLAFAGVSELPLVPYYTYGTPELAEAAGKAIGDKAKALLLANHGMCALESDIKKAYDLALSCEWCARLQYMTEAVGRPHILTNEEMEIAIEKFQGYGQKDMPSDRS